MLFPQRNFWMPIPSFPLYEASLSGAVRRGGRTLRPHTRKSGYQHLLLCEEGRRYCRLVHRLVASAHIPNPLGKREVDHADWNRSNNDVTNLRWATVAENRRHRHPWRRKR